METDTDHAPMQVDDDAKTDSDVLQGMSGMSVDTPADANSEELPPPQSQTKDTAKSPQKKDESNCNNKVIQQQKNEDESTVHPVGTTSSYHGEYHKALMGALDSALDGAFKKYLFSPYSTWLPLFEDSMKENSNKIMHFYPILLHELKKKIANQYVHEFQRINAAQNLAYLQQKMTMTFYDENSATPKDTEPQSLSTSFIQEEPEDETVRYKNPKRTQRDQQMMKINETFRNEIAALDQQIAMAEYKKNELLSQIEEKKKALLAE